MCHSDDPIVCLEDAVRGAAALPGLFLPLTCAGRGREYRLIDGGVIDRLPVAAAFNPPFRPVQLVAVDISADLVTRGNNLARIAEVRGQFPGVPIDCILVDTLRGRSIFYRRSHAQRLLDSGRAAAQAYLELPAAL
jgi:NTE family protein